MDTTHLVALSEGLAREKQGLAESKAPKEREIRRVWIAQRERELEGEMEFLGISKDIPQISDDELLAELLS